MKAKLNWKEIGRFVAVLVQLATIITQAFKKAKVGPEIIDWLTSSGKEIFVEKLEELAAEFTKAKPPEVSKPAEPLTLKAEIDTDLDPKLPFGEAKIEFHAKRGKVTIEKRDGELWIDSKKVILHRSDRQQNRKWIRGHELREELTGKPVLNACVLDFLSENTGFIPDSWKTDADGNTIYIFFWGTIYRNPRGCLYVRHLYWSGGAWHWGFSWLGSDFGYNHAALLAS